MNKPWDEPLPEIDLEAFKNMKDIEVVFDVGARTSLDYLAIKPEATYHLFEPKPAFNEWLEFATKDLTNVFVNKHGLGDEVGEFAYNDGSQAMSGGEAWNGDGIKLPVKTLDWYIKKNNITRIDFLKIDAEGYDFKVLSGGKEAIKLCKYIQYEHWDNLQQFHDLLEKDFEMEYIGLRNVLCTRRKN
jgi:FkbM family methyltransferase